MIDIETKQAEESSIMCNGMTMVEVAPSSASGSDVYEYDVYEIESAACFPYISLDFSTF